MTATERRRSASGAQAVDEALRSIWYALARHVPHPERRLSASTRGPDGVARGGTCPSTVADALQALDDLLPLERDAGRGVWEHLELDVRAEDRDATVRVRNAMGLGERIAAWHVGRGVVEAGRWASCRLGTRDLGTGWDVARRTRRVVPYCGARFVIDPGACHVVDLVTAMGGTTRHSCEGHPEGAYLAYEGAPDVRKVFAAAGWRTEPFPGGSCVRMPKARDVMVRDAHWRRMCAILEARLRATGGTCRTD